jgi:long-chain acyl-CoA synthetase
MNLTYITDSFVTHAHHSPDKIAIHCNNQHLNYQDWYNRVCKTATWLESFNLSNNTVGILLPNGIPFLQLFCGATMAGFTAVLFDLKWKEAELQIRLAVSKPSILITTKELYQHVKHLSPKMLILEDCLEEINHTLSISNKSVGNPTFYMGFTSGTTGAPKAFIRSHESWVCSFDCNRFDFDLNGTDHVLIPGALIHSHFLYGAISTLHLGGTVYLLEKFTPSQTLSLLQSQPITTLYVVPTMIEALLKEGQLVEKSVKIISSGAKWSENSKQEIRNLFQKMTMYEFYGASELSFITVLSDEENKRRVGSVGKPCYGVEFQIRDTNNEVVNPYQTGKIYVKSKLIFSGYLDAHSGAIQSIQDEDGWATVDDLGYVDDEGFLYIVGREKNMILYGAINIYPEEIEKVIETHPEVEEVAVIGLEDPYWGQIVAAVVTGKASKRELRKLCKEQLTSCKIPRKWIFMNNLPYTTSGKIARAQLKELIESEVNCD